MTVDGVNRVGDELLTLRSEMEDLLLVPPWIEHLASEHAISDSLQFAMNLCLEEVLSNVIRHGYANKPGQPIFVRYKAGDDGSFLLIVDDQAPRFDPLAAEPSPVEETLEGIRIGGLGIRLLRSFAASLKYEPTPAGNRLSMGFSLDS
jgi:anti-sigma regulatory factor (Ser/Thr protein kinase)